MCTSCQKQLQNTMFVFEEESIICENCYENKFAKTCYSCRRPIVGVSFLINVLSSFTRKGLSPFILINACSLLMSISPSSHVSQRRTSAGIRNTLSALVAVPTSLRVCLCHTTNSGCFILINALSLRRRVQHGGRAFVLWELLWRVIWSHMWRVWLKYWRR